VRGCAVAEQGLPAEGIAQMRESLGVHRAMHLQVVFTYFLALFAETLHGTGTPEKRSAR